MRCAAVFIPLYLRWDTGAGVRQRAREWDIQLGGVSVVAVLLRMQGVRGQVGDSDLQHHQPLIWQGEHLHAVLVSTQGHIYSLVLVWVAVKLHRGPS